MKYRLFLIVILLFSFLFVGCGNEQFKLDNVNYNTSSYSELDVESFNEKIKNKESFAVFIYQPLCSNSYDFNKVLTDYVKNNEVNFYKMSFSNMKETSMNDYVKYYPSFVIFNKGKMVDYLDAESNDDLDTYKSVEGFEKWFTKYVLVNEREVSLDIIEEEVEDDLKIDTELDNVKYNKNKVNIYFFWGDGCPHCEEQFKFINSIETEYGDYFTLHTFEVWKNDDNKKLLNKFAKKMGDEVKGVPYTIIGNKTFTGFSSKQEKDMLDAIKEQYKDSYDVYFD